MPKGKRQFKKIVFIIADTLRQGNLETNSKHLAKTPNLDRLKKIGISFTNAYTTITKTCPSISSIMSGNYPLHLGLVNHANVDSENLISKEEEVNIKQARLLSEILRENGYKTASVDWLSLWFRKGFDYYSGPIGAFLPLKFRFESKPILFYLNSLKSLTVRILKREFFTRYYFCFSKNPSIPYDAADIVISKGISLLNKNKKKKMFLYLHLWDTHEPHIRPRGLKSYLFDTVDDTYIAEIEFIDLQLGKLIDYLEKTEQLEDTLIIFTSDHGENFYESGSPFAHDMLYENVTKIPLIISNPSFSKKEIRDLVQNIDIFPTLLELLRIRINNKVDGVSLVPFLNGGKKIKRQFVYFEDILKKKRLDFLKKTRRRGIRQDNYKFIQTVSGEKTDLIRIMPTEDLSVVSRELYDLRKDPKEKHNIIDNNKNKAKELEAKLYDLIRELNFKRLKTNPALAKKVKISMDTILKASKKYQADKIAIAWTGGKDSTVLLSLVRLVYGGKIPFKVIFNDSTMEFDEIYKFIDKVKKLWGLDLITIKHSKRELKEFEGTPDRERKKELSRLMKITAINAVVKRYKLKALIAGIRWDEHESRSRETYFSKRKDHDRVHPILHFKEKDIWEYIHHFGVPYVNLYSKGYRSLGEKPFTKKAEKGGGERSGREREKEQLMQNLRKLGYW